MSDFCASNSLCNPLIAVLTSTGADAIAEKNNLNFADMLAPFCTVSTNIKDPVGNNISSKLSLDLRDIRRSGFLLSHTVLPHVLRENVASFPPNGGAENVFATTFAGSFLYWFEPAGHDFLRAYISCLFIVSVGDADPMEELNRLQYQQHLQQHGGADSSTSLSLAHCCSPKWMLPNILKHYVVVQDILQHPDERAKEVFSNVSKKYGSSSCHLVRINSTDCSQLPNPWANIVDRRYRGLNAGLERARRAILEKSSAEIAHEVDGQNQYIPSAQISRSSTTSSFSTLSANNGNGGGGNSLFSLAIPQIILPARTQNVSPQTVPAISNGYIPTSNSSTTMANAAESTNASTSVHYSPKGHGQCLDAGDRERLKSFVEEFVRSALTPFVEHQLVLQNETLANRRTIGRSLNSMRKWLSAASSTTNTTTSNVSYGIESSEWQTRCLADMAFQFGLYNFAHQLYQSLKKDFANDQAWLHHAGALEMAALTSYLGYVYNHQHGGGGSATFSPATIAQMQKNYPQRYMDNAINYYLNVCLQPLLALRCILISVAILTRLELCTEAANHLILLNTLNFPDLFAGVLLEQAGRLFESAKKRRRMAFYTMLAGHRYVKAELPQFALACYRRVLPLLTAVGGWNFAEDHILYTLTAQHEFLATQSDEFGGGAKFAIECAARLLRPNGKQSAEQQRIFLTNYVNLSRKYEIYVAPFEFAIPQIDMRVIKIFYGDFMGSSRALRATTFSSSATGGGGKRLPLNGVVPDDFQPGEGFDGISLVLSQPSAIWEELEQVVLQFHNSKLSVPGGIAGSVRAELQSLFSDEWTENEHAKMAPPLEPITLQLELRNPLAVPLTLKNLRLGVNIPNSGGEMLPSMISVENVEKLTLMPISTSQMNGRESPRSIDSRSSFRSRIANGEELEEEGNVSTVVSLSVTPMQPIDLLSIERVDFDVCAPPPTSSSTPPMSANSDILNNGEPPDSVSGFIPLRTKGKRLFANKKHRRSPTYATDNRLKVRVAEKCWPLLDFRMAGASSGGRAASTVGGGGYHHVNAYCNQIYQVITEVENVGRVPVTRLYMCTDRPELVSLSEEQRLSPAFRDENNAFQQPQLSRWQLCASSWLPSSAALLAANGSQGLLIHQSANIVPGKPCAPGHKLTLRLAFRAPSEPVKDHQISVLFLYVDDASGTTRQFRYRLAFSAQTLLGASLRPLNACDGLCVLQLRNLISARDPVLARIELQRFSPVLLALRDNQFKKSAKPKGGAGANAPFTVVNALSSMISDNSSSTAELMHPPGIYIRPIFKKSVILESEQSQNYCFYLDVDRQTQHEEEDAQVGQNLARNEWRELWVSEFVADIPVWSHLLPAGGFLPHLADGVSAALSTALLTLEANDEASLETDFSELKLKDSGGGSSNSSTLFHLRLAVLWKAYITNSDGTVATVFGENLLANPFIPASSATPFGRVPGSAHVFVASDKEFVSSGETPHSQKHERFIRSRGELLGGSPSASFRDRPNPFVGGASGSPPVARHPTKTAAVPAGEGGASSRPTSALSMSTALTMPRF